jgi:DNA polymerase-3 subunit alpha
MRNLNLDKKELTFADKLLVQKTIEGITDDKYADFNEALIARMEYELNIIINMGFSNYFLIVQDFLSIGRKIGHMPKERLDYLKTHYMEMGIKEMVDYIDADQSMPGLTIGPGRGSAAGSLVAYLLGITSIDPIKNGLLFERFLNPERVSMPDIDSDLSKSDFDYGVRDIVIEYVSKKYQHDGICGITTPSTLAARAAIKAIARIYGSKKIKKMSEVKKLSQAEEDQIKSEYLKLGDLINTVVPKEPNTTFFGKISDKSDATVDDALRNKFRDNQDAMDIITMAEKLEGVSVNFGRHACGIIISDNGDVGEYAPLMMDTDSGTYKIQMDAEQAEAKGFLKMDFLGLKNLNIITMVLREIYENYGIKLDALHLPKTGEIAGRPIRNVYSDVFSAGLTNAVFQFESAGMKKMLKKFGPESFDDIVLLVACYRPGPMQYLEGIISRKHGRPTALTALDRIKECHDIVAPTYGAIVYQEQVQQVFRNLAGYSLGQADNVRRAMGHKKMDILVKEEDAFLHGDASRNIKGCEANGINLTDAAELFSNMIDFAKYAFNKSHAAAYAETAYITAWLKANFPTEFYASTLNFTDAKKMPGLIAEAAKFGVVVKGPDINMSQNIFSGKGNEIYFGFSGIKGIGASAEDVAGPYKSIPDFLLRSSLSDSTIGTLIDVGAFDRFCACRTAVKDSVAFALNFREIIRKKTKDIARFKEMLSDVNNGIELDRKKYKITTKGLPGKANLEKKISEAEEAIEENRDAIKGMIIPQGMADDKDANFAKEKELLGMYVSGHPLDLYGTPEEYRCQPIGDLEVPDEKSTSFTRIFGMVTGLTIRQRKSDGADMAFFTLEDKTGSIDVKCFTEQYTLFGNMIKEGVPLILVGNIKVDDSNNQKKSGADNTSDERDDSQEEVNLEFILSKKNLSVCNVAQKQVPYCISIEGTEKWEDAKSEIVKYQIKNGHALYVFNETTKSLGTCPYCVSDDILHNEHLNITVKN